MCYLSTVLYRNFAVGFYTKSLFYKSMKYPSTFSWLYIATNVFKSRSYTMNV
uniref:Uncharacterized protein n=1 Tax=Anguilla anguilla TaxID=7936 RepID=A0A0E9VLE6_ANGAN